VERFIIEGGARLHGEVEVSGAKNAALKLIAAALLAPGRTTLHNVPRIKDVDTMLAVLDGLGAETRFYDHTLEIDGGDIGSYTAPYDLVRKMRASIVVLGPLVARFGEFKRLGITLDNIPPGSRGVDLEGRADPRAQWKSHNYTHLVEQPTLFYAIALTLAVMNMGGGYNYWLAWAYVGLRVIHSLIQGTVNIVKYRLLVFVLATACLLALTAKTAVQMARDCGLI